MEHIVNGTGYLYYRSSLTIILSLIAHHSLIFLSNPPAEPSAIAEYSPNLLERIGLYAGFARN
jgi:hypothetical protein